MKTRKILTYVGYGFFGLFVFILFTYLNFPYNKLKDKIFSQVHQQSGLQIDADELKTTLTLGVVLTDVELSHRSLPFPIKLDEVKASPSLLSLLTFKPKVNYRVGVGRGLLSGHFKTQGGHTQDLALNIKRFSIKSKQLKERMNLSLAGILNGEVHFKGNVQQSNTWAGSSQLKLKKFMLGKMKFLNMNIPSIKMSSVDLQSDLIKEKLTIKKFNAGSAKDDIQANASGNVFLNAKNIRLSRLDLNVKFKLSDKLKEEFSLFLPFIATALGSDGFYSIKIAGTIGSPRANPARK